MIFYMVFGMCFGAFIETTAITSGMEPMSLPQRILTVLLCPIFLLYFIIELFK